MTDTAPSRNRRPLTLRDVSEASGVSEMTVSRVLRNRGDVSQTTRERVLEAAKDLGYVPNKIAGALASQRVNLVAVIIPSLSNMVFPEVMTGINEVLASAHDRREIMQGATSVAVPRLGEWCVVAVLPGDGGRIPDIEVAHVDPEMVALARDLQERIPYDPDARTGLANVIRSGVTEFYPEIDEQVLESVDAPEEGKEVARQLELRSAILVPLIKRGRTIGAMQFVNSSHARHYTPDDVALAEAVASRVASSLENRRLSEMLRKGQFRAALDAMLDDVAIARAVRDDDGEIIDFRPSAATL